MGIRSSAGMLTAPFRPLYKSYCISLYTTSPPFILGGSGGRGGGRSLVDKTLNPLGFSPLWFEPTSGHMWESQVLLTDGQVVFLRVLRFSPTFDEQSVRYK